MYNFLGYCFILFRFRVVAVIFVNVSEDLDLDPDHH
jgi:hypothetical protein